MKIELNGWKGVAALLLVGGALGGKFLFERSTLETGAAQVIKFRLQGEYTSRALNDVDPASLSDAELETTASELLALEEIAFTSMGVRGRGDDVAVRVEIRVAGSAPPDGRGVRYYRLSHRLITGWRVEREITALSYYLKLL